MQNSQSASTSFLWVMGLVLTGLVAGCSGGDGGSGGGGTANAAPGTLGVSLTDAPACGYDQVNVTVDRVRVHRSNDLSVPDNDAGWNDIAVDPQNNRIDLLGLTNGVLVGLGETSLGTGHYTQVRLVLVPNDGSPTPKNSVVLSDTKVEKLLETPSAVQSGIKLVHEFAVPSGQRVDLLLDFDACKSIVKAGNSGKYILKPVIKVIPFVLNGIEGYVHTALLGNNVIVSAQRNNGEIVRATVPNPQTGKFFLTRLPGSPLPGDYPANYDVVITADSHATAVIAAVPVQAAPNITTISTSGAPFTLAQDLSPGAVGGTVKLSPADDNGTVIVAAKQTLKNSGPTVTVKSVVATVFDTADPIGDYGYNMPLPTAAPWLGQYSTTLPIVLSATVPDQSTVAKIYTIQGSAQVVTTTGTTVYATQNPPSSAKDITIVANQTQDFTLSSP